MNWTGIAGLILLLNCSVAWSDIYKWTDEHGKTHFSDTETTNRTVETVKSGPINSFSYIPDNHEVVDSLSRVDTYQLPHQRSEVPFRFALTSAMNLDEPIDRLHSINIDIKQRSFYAYVKLIGADPKILYKYRIRILDANGELMFDQNLGLITKTHSAYFVAKIAPNVSIDSPGQWTFQGVLNDKRLFVEKRNISF